MAGEVVEILSAVPGGVVIDATVGGGGHAARLLAARPDLRLLALDRDEAAVEAARRELARFGDRVTVVHAGFERLGEVVTMNAAGDAVTGALLDLGVSSHQLDEPSRGFSYRHDAPLDMRMDTTQPTTAAHLVNDLDEAGLARVLRTYGEERFARRIAREIVRRRPLATTGDLVDAVRAGVPAATRRTGGHPARRTFQALRIAVNDEMAHLEAGLGAAFDALAPGGRMVVLSYHSLEDRIVKRRFADWSTGGTHPPGMPTKESARGGAARLLTRRALRPSRDEVAGNPRAESARLRALERAGPERPRRAGED